MDSTLLVAYLVLFCGAATGVILGGLLIGRLLRPHRPTPEKLQTYECGEPAVGTADVQFDLRFYVIALVFLIFDVEVAVFFPWGVVFGKATHLRDRTASEAALTSRVRELGLGSLIDVPTEEGGRVHDQPVQAAEVQRAGRTLHSIALSRQVTPNVEQIHTFGNQLAWMVFLDVLIFFAILLVGFAYLWHRGDLVWVRTPPSESVT